MKKYIFVFLLIPVLAFKCGKGVVSDCLQGKVIRTSCASFVVQVTNNNSIGEDGWKDMVSGKRYDNVINVSNRCQLPASLSEGSIIKFKTGSTKENDCVQCMMYDAPPSVSVNVTLCEDAAQ